MLSSSCLLFEFRAKKSAQFLGNGELAATFRRTLEPLLFFTTFSNTVFCVKKVDLAACKIYQRSKSPG